MTDHVLDGMADELRNVLRQRGLDPKNPPVGQGIPTPPAEAAFQEYTRRGGNQFQNADRMVSALITKVQNGR
jgi:hypothetical protein